MGRTIRARDGLALVRRDWPSAGARGTIVIVHGLGEHIGRYAHVAARLNASRWSVVGYDQRGHGASPGERGRIAGGDDLLADLAAVVAAYRADPLVHDRIAPRLIRFLADAGPLVRESAPRWNVPTLLLYAGSDRLVVPAGSAAFAAAAPAAVVTARPFASLFHEIFNEPEQDEVLAVLTAWLDTLNHSPPTRSPR